MLTGAELKQRGERRRSAVTKQEITTTSDLRTDELLGEPQEVRKVSRVFKEIYVQPDTSSALTLHHISLNCL